MENSKGITLTSLAITIVLTLILATIVITTSIQSLRRMSLENFKYELEEVQRKVDEIISDYAIYKKVNTNASYKEYFEAKFGSSPNFLKDRESLAKELIEAKTVLKTNKESELVFYFTEKEVKTYFGLKGIKDIVVDFSTRYVYSVKGCKDPDNNKIYYCAEDYGGSIVVSESISIASTLGENVVIVANSSSQKIGNTIMHNIILNIENRNEIGTNYPLKKLYYSKDRGNTWVEEKNVKINGDNVNFVLYNGGSYLFKIVDSSGAFKVSDNVNFYYADVNLQSQATDNIVTLIVNAEAENCIQKVYIKNSENNVIFEKVCNKPKIEERVDIEIPFYNTESYYAVIEANSEEINTNVLEFSNYEYIRTEGDLRKFASIVNGGTSFAGKKTIKQVADIQLTQNHTVIGTNTHPFDGIYDGQEHVLKNVIINQTTSYDYGVFGYVQGTASNSAEITGLTVEGSITGPYDVGGIAGRVNFAIIRNCVNKATIKSTSGEVSNSINYSSTGGIVGRIGSNGAIIENCENYGTISSSKEGIGGIIGWVRVGIVIGCKNYVDINTSAVRVGGIIGAGIDATDGAANYTLNISECINEGNITGKCGIGGICGFSEKVTITSCKNNGMIKATGAQGFAGLTSSNSIGGIIGVALGQKREMFNY